jgi:hypothetical protein
MRKLLYLLLLGTALWSGYWFVGSSAIRSQVETWFANQAKTGMVAENTGLNVSGFPNRFDLTIDGLHLSDPGSGIGWRAPFVQVFAMTWKPWHIIMALPPEQVVALPDQTIALNSEGLRASVRAKPTLDAPLAAIILESDILTATSTAGWTTGATRTVVSMIVDEEVPGAGDQPNTYVFSVDVANLTPDPRFMAAVKAVTIPELPASDLPDQVDTLSSRILLTSSVPLDRNVAQTRPYLTRVEIKETTFTWGQLSATAKGQVQADDQGFAAGEVTVQVTNWNRLPALLVAAKAITPEAAPTVARGMQALAAQSADLSVLSLKLTLADGRMSFGPFPLGPAPLMLPPSG